MCSSFVVPSDSPERYNVESPESNGRPVMRGCELWLSAAAPRDTGSHSSPRMARAFITRGDKSSSFVKTAAEFQIRRGTETSAEAFHTKHFRYKPEGRAIT